ncbi:hypothetical protein KAI32_04605 [Candidatus Pacearchaeota archaeon]|nr:hypothetical protein [Candidatus Pacearchaeota archaeon]
MKRMIDSATNRKNKKEKTDKIQEDIFNTLKSTSHPVATQEISDIIKKSWHSVQTRCLKLQIDNKIIGFRVGRINLWQVK